MGLFIFLLVLAVVAWLLRRSWLRTVARTREREALAAADRAEAARLESRRELPAPVAPEPDLPFVLDDAEPCYASFRGVSLLAWRREQVGYSGGSTGISLPTGIRGVRLSTRRHGGRVRASETVLRAIDSGDLLLTGRRLLFKGAARSLELDLRKVFAVRVEAGNLLVSVRGRQNPYILGTFRYPLTVSALVKKIAGAAGQEK